jgi:hypothetical protein
MYVLTRTYLTCMYISLPILPLKSWELHRVLTKLAITRRMNQILTKQIQLVYTPKVIPWGQTDKQTNGQTNKQTDGWTNNLLNIRG